MNKEEILKKSRAQKEDEGVIYGRNHGRHYGYIGLLIMIGIYLLIFIFAGGNFTIPMSLWSAFLGADYYGRYRISKDKRELFYCVFVILAGICFTLNYLLVDLLKVIS